MPRCLAFRQSLLILLLLLVLFVSACSSDSDDCQDDSNTPADVQLPASWTVSISATAPDPVAWTAEDVRSYLEQMGLTVTLQQSDGEISCTNNQGQVVFVGDGLGEAIFDSESASEQTFRMEETRCENGILVQLSGGGLLGRQYAGYEWLHKLGVRFFHPEEEYVPTSPKWPVEPLVYEHTPAFTWRSVSLHLTHPLELGDAFKLDPENLYPEAKRYIDWQIKNGASNGHGGVGSDEWSDYGLQRGFATSTGFSLYNQQQGGSSLIDPDDPRSSEQQVTDAIDEKMGDDPENYPDLFGFTFNPTEFTERDDREVVQILTLISNYMAENYPDTIVMCINHGTYGEPTDFYGVRYYDLPQFAPENLGVKVHTLMFYDLFRPAPMYGNENFNFAYDFMAQEYTKRRLWHFPEAAWWLTFDIAVPLYLPITIEARDVDIQGIAFMLNGGLDGHHVFGTGHEWGYWQNEYCSFRMAMDLDYRYTDCLADIASPMGTAANEVQSVLDDMIRSQQRDLIYGDILKFLVGTDPETEVAASIGVEFHPLPPAPLEIMSWDLDTVNKWVTRFEPELHQMETDYMAFLDRLAAVEAQVPEGGLPWFNEIRDGIEVSMLRARHARQVYGAVITLRRAQLTVNAEMETQATELLEAAKQSTADALEVIARREQGYRYQPVSRSIDGGENCDSDENWTIYKYRYLCRTHTGYYYTRIDGLVEEAMQGSSDPVAVQDALLGDDEKLVLDVIDPGLSNVSVDLGDGNSATGTHIEHEYAASGVYDLSLTAEKEGSPYKFTGSIAKLSTQYITGFSGKIKEPAGVSIIESVLPGLVFGPIDGGKLALGFSPNRQNTVGLTEWMKLNSSAADVLFDSNPADLSVPVISRSNGTIQTYILVKDGKLTLEDIDSKAVINGLLGVEEVVQAVVAIGGFEEEGARDMVAGFLGYTPDTLPESVPFEIEFTLQGQQVEPDGDTEDGDATDGDNPDGDSVDGDTADGDAIDGDQEIAG